MGALALVAGFICLLVMTAVLYFGGYVYRETARILVRPVFLVRRQLLWRLA